MRLQYSEKEMAEFSELPGFIRLLIKDKPEFCEYTLTSELLDHFLKHSFQEAGDLRDGLYSQPLKNLSLGDFID